jgi:hypothetical protein
MLYSDLGELYSAVSNLVKMGVKKGGSAFLFDALAEKFLEDYGILPPLPNPDSSTTARFYDKIHKYIGRADWFLRPIAEGPSAEIRR